jgi:hypothetical protein
MLPRAARTVKRLQAVLDRSRPLWPVVAWGLGLWAAVLAVPLAFLYPDAGVDQPACQILALLAPVGIVIAATSGEAAVVLGVGLAGLVPCLVACPELQGPRTTGPAQALLVGLLAVGFTASAWSRTGRPNPQAASLRKLARWPSGLVDRLLLVLGLAWLAQAWVLHLGAGPISEGSRAARVAGAAVCWLAVRLVPLGIAAPGADPHVEGDRWPLYAGRRLAWLTLCLGLFWLWRKQA